MRRMPLGLVLVTLTVAAPTPAAAAPLPFGVVMQPRLSGNTLEPRVGETLTEISAVYNRMPKSVAYSWRRCAPGQSIVDCAPVPGGDARSYTLQPSDVGFHMVVAETGRSASGETSIGVSPGTPLATALSYTITEADLRYLIAVQAEATAAGGISYSLGPQLYARRLPATRELLREALDLDNVSARHVLKRGLHPKFVPPAAGTVTVTWTTRRSGVRVGRGSARCGPGHTKITIPFRFTRRGRALLRRRPSPPLLWTARFTPADGSPATTFRWRTRLAD